MSQSMGKLVLSFLLLLSVVSIYSQDHFLVELEKFTPPEQDVIRSIKDFPAENFLAKDLSGEEHFLGNYREQAVILWFWSIDDPISLKWLSTLNLIQIEHLEKLKIFGFGKENKEAIEHVLSNEAIIFSNFPNGTLFGDAVYGGDLGLGRMFFIDTYGVVKEVLPRSFFESTDVQEAIPMIEEIIEKIAY